MEPSVVHVVRHGQVHNPDGVLYGRQPGYGLSDLGRQMAERLGEYFADAPLVHLVSSPLQRAQETMAPIAARHPELEVTIDERVIEAANVFEGTQLRQAQRDPAAADQLVGAAQPAASVLGRAVHLDRRPDAGRARRRRVAMPVGR